MLDALLLERAAAAGAAPLLHALVAAMPGPADPGDPSGEAQAH